MAEAETRDQEVAIMRVIRRKLEVLDADIRRLLLENGELRLAVDMLKQENERLKRLIGSEAVGGASGIVRDNRRTLIVDAATGQPVA